MSAELKIRLLIGIILALVLSNWLWFRAGRSYGRNETVGSMALTFRVQPPTAPASSIGILFADDKALHDGTLDAGARIGFVIYGGPHLFDKEHGGGWIVENLFINSNEHIISGVCSETNIPTSKLQRSVQ